MANTLELGNGKWATGKDTVLAFNDENNNFKPLPFSFSRDTSGTVVNKDGLIETVGSGEPRIDFKDNTKGALKLEPTRSNVLPYSEDFSQWDLVRATSTANSTISPDGKNNAYKIQSNVNTTNGSWYREIISSFSGSYELSVFAKSGTTDFLQLRIDGVGGVVYDLSNGVVKSQENATGSVENYGNGWYRCKAQMSASSSTVILMLVGNENMTPQSWATTNGNNIYLYGAQLEQGSYATSYIPTSGSAVTRVADACNQTPPDGVIGQTEGSIYSEFKCLDSITNLILWMRDPSGGNYEDMIKLEVNDSNVFRLEIREGNGNSANITSSVLTVGNYYKVAVAYKQNDYVVYINGVQIGTDSSGNVPTCSEMYIGRYIDGGIRMGVSKDLKLYNTRLSNSELAALTQ